MDEELAIRRRDRRLRKRILSTVKLAMIAPAGEIGGRTLCDCVDNVMPRDQRFESDEHALRLVREMVAKGYLAERDTRSHPRRQRFALDHLSFKVTQKGIDLWNENLPADPDVEDDRIED